MGQMTRNFYTQELGVLKNSKNFVRNTQAQHLNEVRVIITDFIAVMANYAGR